jgi:predicted HAD superfamily phosphohydrolase YqeG
MSAGAARAGVCIVRVEPLEHSLLVTITINRALNRDLYSATAEHVRKFSDLERAMEAVGEFLDSYRTT